MSVKNSELPVQVGRKHLSQSLDYVTELSSGISINTYSL